MPTTTTTHTIKAGEPVTIEGITIELEHTGKTNQAGVVAETAVVKITTTDSE